ncbi:hypothetical protein [Desulforamulus hydrothermalis]|uniref:Uncharacterized protein n=1 Tax=Desulforamulus hydrothermalis Lam5 = DSM 18033 TaxID=1121428 RepID=K8E9G9_9FIRM|nr:hypothetical protein [Desulforamulus hydrothermalis]CCO08208.1 conserved hypothetical protein [Desulforamulus hydrothermalis Lam5 = DSM 18033]SHH22422.1 hypothetical protein SAMN02745177_01872 [Desulforamulus hydrothermalis Lam5 = DSM 18033]
MQHPTNTRIIFADSVAEAREKYLALNIKTKDPNPGVEVLKPIEDEEFDINSDINLIGEVSVGPSIMEEIRKDPARAFVVYFLEDPQNFVESAS